MCGLRRVWGDLREYNFHLFTVARRSYELKYLILIKYLTILESLQNLLGNVLAWQRHMQSDKAYNFWQFWHVINRKLPSSFPKPK